MVFLLEPPLPVESQLVLDALEPTRGGLLDQAYLEIGKRRSALVDLVEHGLEVVAVRTQDLARCSCLSGSIPAYSRQGTSRAD